MKKILITIIIILIAGFGFYYVSHKNVVSEIKDTNIPIVENKTQEIEKNKRIDTKEVRIGDMVFEVPIDVDINKSDTNINLNIKGDYINSDTLEHTGKSLSINIIYDKNSNFEKKPLKDWFDENGPQTEKTSATSEYDKEKLINKLNYLESFYKAPTSFYTSSYYSVIVNYFSNNKDIYSVIYYKEPEKPEIPMTKEEKLSIQSYQKIVDVILNSIHFVR